MAVIMVAPMVALMLWFMRDMFPNKKLNLGIILSCIVIFTVGFYALRQQTFVGDTQFLKSMIPHHSIAIKNCERANLHDAEVKSLCVQIIRSQQSEIDQMKSILNRL